MNNQQRRPFFQAATSESRIQLSQRILKSSRHPLWLAVTFAALLLVSCQSPTSTQLVLLKTYISTNTTPGYIGGPKPNPQVGPDGYLMQLSVNAIAINYPPKTNVVTNYVIGYRTANGKSVEVLNVP